MSAVAGFVADHGGNIVDADQHTDDEAGMFFQRVEFRLAGFDLGRTRCPDALRPVTEPLGMQWQLRLLGRAALDRRPRLAADALPLRPAEPVGHRRPARPDRLRGQQPPDVRGRPPSASGSPSTISPSSPDNRAEQEHRLAELAAEAGVELIVLARYMQVLSPSFIDRFPSRIINIHHSFLPAFVGARPYHQAYERGVKIIGVTAHYATADLDQGPIIEQDVVPVSHRDGVEDLVRMGRDLETVVLARAVRHHLTDRVLVCGRKTVVFA